MKKTILFPVITLSVLLLASCQETPKQEATTETTSSTTETPKADMAQVRSDIAAVENQWAAAVNAKDINAVMALYSEDAISMPDGEPTLSGKAAIQKRQEAEFAKQPQGTSIGFETTEVFAQGDVVTEVGKAIYKDAAGKVTGSGKYIAIFEKRDGKYLCIREIYNRDTK